MGKKKRAEREGGVTRTVFVGGKRIGAYIAPAEAFLKEDGSVVISGRGNRITRCVDVAEIIKKDYEVLENISIGSESVMGHQDVELNVSTISINLKVKKE